MKLVRTDKPLLSLLLQSGLGRFGDHMAGVVYGWGILQQTGSGLWSGLVIASHIGVLVVGTLFAGRLIARFGARRVAITGAWTSAVAAAAVAGLFALGTADPLLIALVAAIGASLDGPANIAAETNYPEVARIARWNLLQLNAFDDGLDNAAALFAPAVGAALVASFGVGAAAGTIAALALASAVIVTMALPGFRNAASEAGLDLGPVLRFMRKDDVLFPMTVLFSLVLGIFLAIELVALPLAVKQSGGAPSIVAAFLAAAAAGSLSGALATVSLRRRLVLGPVVALSFLGLAAGALLLASGTNLWLTIAAGVITGLPSGIVTPIAITLFQSRPPRAMRADVQAVAGALVFAATPVALLLTGAAADSLAVGEVLIAMAAILAALAALALAWLPRLRLDDVKGASREGAP